MMVSRVPPYKIAIFLFIFISLLNQVYPGRPNILLIVADDLGWNDVGFNNPYAKTPNIDKLAQEGVILDQSYVQPVCSPTRSAMLTGRYPHTIGLQHYVINPRQATCLPPNVPVLPQQLKDLGYATHMVGKWHLGFCNWNCTPTGKGFDTHFGYFNSHEDYWDHTRDGYLDFWENRKPYKLGNGTYSTDLFWRRAVHILNHHDKSKPLFLYLPFQTAHEPMQVPRKYEDLYSSIKSKGRRLFLGMVSAMDDAIGHVVRALKRTNLYDDTIILFTADNGGWIQYYGNNYPLRGGKATVWEGGTRAAAFIHGKALKKSKHRYTGMLHAVDWFPTILSLAGGKEKIPNAIDGLDQWQRIQRGIKSKRHEFVYQLDDCFPPLTGQTAIRVGDYKLVEGFTGFNSSWYPPQEVTGESEKDTLIDFKLPYAPPCTSRWKMPDIKYKQRLYNVKDDPTERNDLVKEMPEVVKRLSERLRYHKKQMVQPNFPADSPGSDPRLWGRIWSPGWC